MIDVVASGSGMLVTITGDLDLSSRDQAEATLRRIGLRERPNLTVDLCRMRFMDSTGAAWIAALVEQDRRLGGSTVLRGASLEDLQKAPGVSAAVAQAVHDFYHAGR